MIEIIPAIDLRSGRCVRLYQGDYQRETVYSGDPLSVALEWERQGAPRLHVVDLDGAAQGRPANLETIRGIVQRLSIPVQVGGGIRDEETAECLFAAGVDRVVIGTAAVQDPSLVAGLCRRHGSSSVVVAVDAQDGRVAIKGWTERSQLSALELARRVARLGATRLLHTDISRDGAMAGPNIAASAALARDTGMAVLASGGFTSLDHIRLLADTGVEGAILGRALYTGDILLPNALAVAREQAGETKS